MDTGNVTTKGQLVIPARIRRRYGIKAGTKVHFIERGDELVLQPVTSASIRRLCGALKSEASVSQELLGDRMVERQREDRNLAHRHSR